jgi:hypothetical protein
MLLRQISWQRANGLIRVGSASFLLSRGTEQLLANEATPDEKRTQASGGQV